MDLRAWILMRRVRAETRRAARERRRRLERELAGYASPSARLDFEATLDRYSDGVTWELREILSQQAAAWDARHPPGSRPRR